MKYDRNNPTPAEKTARAIYKSFECTQCGIGEQPFVEHASVLINAHAQFVNAEKTDEKWIAIASWNEERERALREARRVIEWRKCATGLARAVRCRNMDMLAESLSEFDHLNK